MNETINLHPDAHPRFRPMLYINRDKVKFHLEKLYEDSAVADLPFDDLVGLAIQSGPFPIEGFGRVYSEMGEDGNIKIAFASGVDTFVYEHPGSSKMTEYTRPVDHIYLEEIVA